MSTLTWYYTPFLEAPVKQMTILRIMMRTVVKTNTP